MSIIKELKILSNKLKLEGHSNYHNEARKLINIKYGDNWRDNLTIEQLNKSKEKNEMSYY